MPIAIPMTTFDNPVNEWFFNFWGFGHKQIG